MRFKFDVQSDPTSFYNDIQMLGHRWAAETVDKIVDLFKVAKTKKQKALANALVDKHATGWHYFNNITDKEISQWSYVIRRIDRVAPVTLLRWLNNKPGCLKTHLHHILEAMSYVYDQDEYLEDYTQGFGAFGMDRDTAVERFHAYHAIIAEKKYVKDLAH